MCTHPSYPTQYPQHPTLQHPPLHYYHPNQMYVYFLLNNMVFFSVFILQYISHTIDVSIVFECKQGDDWGALNRVLTHSGWSKVKRVSLTIFIRRFFRPYNLEEMVRSLPQIQFPRLSSSRSVVFQFSVIDQTDK
jgi:hypothetical protein